MTMRTLSVHIPASWHSKAIIIGLDPKLQADNGCAGAISKLQSVAKTPGIVCFDIKRMMFGLVITFLSWPSR